MALLTLDVYEPTPAAAPTPAAVATDGGRETPAATARPTAVTVRAKPRAVDGSASRTSGGEASPA
jgi:hypothetical protein